MGISIGILTGLVAMLCWGVADFLQAIPIKRLGALKTMYFSNLINLVFIILLLAAYSSIAGIIAFNKSLLLIILAAAAVDVVAVVSFMKSFEVGEVSIVAPISATYSLVTVILAFLFLGESLSLLKTASIMIIVVGIVLTSTDLRKIKHLHSAKGVRESLIALVFWGIYFFMLGVAKKSLMPEHDALSVAALIFFYTSLTNSVLLLGFSAFKGGAIKKAELKDKNIMLIFFLNLFLYTIAWISMNYGMAKDFVSLVAPVSSLYPAITVILAVIFFKDKLVLNQKMGILAILLGIFLISI